MYSLKFGLTKALYIDAPSRLYNMKYRHNKPRNLNSALCSVIPCNVDLCPILIDKLQPIRSLGSQSRDEEYEALTKGSGLGNCQGSGGCSFATRVGGTAYLVGWAILGSRKAQLEGMVVD